MHVSRLITAAACISVFATSAAAQNRQEIPQGARVRVWLREAPHTRVDATLESWDGNRLILLRRAWHEKRDTTRTYTTERISRLTAYVPLERSESAFKNMKRFAIFSGAVGLGLSLLMAGANAEGASYNNNVILITPTFAIFGGAIGYAGGLAAPGHGWKPIYEEPWTSR